MYVLLCALRDTESIVVGSCSVSYSSSRVGGGARCQTTSGTGLQAKGLCPGRPWEGPRATHGALRAAEPHEAKIAAVSEAWPASSRGPRSLTGGIVAAVRPAFPALSRISCRVTAARPGRLASSALAACLGAAWLRDLVQRHPLLPTCFRRRGSYPPASCAICPT